MLYPDRESEVLELKSALPEKGQIIKTILAFCNHFGGKLVLGVNDDRSIKGVDESNVENLIASLSQSIYQSCTPIILPSIYTRRMDDKLLVVIEVSSGMNKPYCVTALGRNKGVFIRSGSNTVLASVDTIQELTWKNKGFSADEMPIYAAGIDQVDQEKFTRFLKTHRHAHQPKNIESQLKNYKIIYEEHQRIYPTLGGNLLFGQHPEKYAPEAFIILSHFAGTEGRRALATVDATGSLFEQVDTAIAFILSRLNQSFKIEDTQRKTELEMPEVAIREALVNAIVHRDYYMPGPIKVAIYDNRIELFSPGGFPGPMRDDQLEEGLTFIRNHVIARVFREAGYVEKLGSGFLTIFNTYRKAKLTDPVVISGSGYIKCILPRTPKIPAKKMHDFEEQIMKLLSYDHQIQVAQIIEKTGLSRQSVARKLAHLVQAGMLERSGKGRAVRYQLRRVQEAQH